MFRKVTVIRLIENNSLLSFDLDWPARIKQKLDGMGNIDMLRYSGLLTGSFSKVVTSSDNISGCQTLLMPIHHAIQNRSTRWVTDISEKQYLILTDMIQSVCDVIKSPSLRCWYVKSKWTDNDLSDQYKIDIESARAKLLQELEMMLYASPVNQERDKHRQLSITGLMTGNIENKGCLYTKNIIGDGGFVKMLNCTQSLQSWLETPKSQKILILGNEAGDQELYRVKETLMFMMEHGMCDVVEVIQSNSHDIYSASRFYNAYSKWRHYLFSKQTI